MGEISSIAKRKLKTTMKRIKKSNVSRDFQLKKESLKNKALKSANTLIKDFETKIKTYEKKWKSQTNDNSVTTKVAKFEKFYKKIKVNLNICLKNVKKTQEKIADFENNYNEKMNDESDSLKGFGANSQKKLNNKKEGLKRWKGDVKKYKTYLENLIKQFKDLRQKEKELLGNQKQLISPEYLKNKLKTIKKNMLATTKDNSNGEAFFKCQKHAIELNELLTFLNEKENSVNSKKGEQYSYKQGIACFSKIKEAADKECENKILTSNKIKEASSKYYQTIQHTWDSVESKIKSKINNNASDTSYYRTCFTLGLLSGFYIEAEKSSKYLYSKLETFRSEVNKYTDSKLKRAFKFTAPLLAGLVGVAASITGVFKMELASAILWLIAQASYSSSEATESFDEIVRKSKSPQSSEAIEEFIKSVEELSKEETKTKNNNQ